MNKLIDIVYLCKKTKYDLLNDKQMQHEFGKKIESGIPFLAGKLGAGEAFNLRVQEFHYNRKMVKACEQLSVWSGFFPEDVTLLPKFCDIYHEVLGQVDYINPIGSKGENYFIKKYCKDDVKFCEGLGVWANQYPWSKSLEGKTVLVIHPYVQSIKYQYENNREKLFANKDILPQFNLKTMQSVQTIGTQTDNRFKDWFEALDYMCSECSKIDYDIALVGCGAYGLPLSGYIKKQGKIAIHMGGDLQMLFGIRGKRWDSHSIASKIMNEYWKYPESTERPSGYMKVENGCYW